MPQCTSDLQAEIACVCVHKTGRQAAPSSVAVNKPDGTHLPRLLNYPAKGSSDGHSVTVTSYIGRIISVKIDRYLSGHREGTTHC